MGERAGWSKATPLCEHWGHKPGEWFYACCACSGAPGGCDHCETDWDGNLLYPDGVLPTQPAANQEAGMSDLTPEEHAKLAVDGSVIANGACYIEASDDPRGLPTLAWLNVQWLHLQGDENGLLELVERLWADAYDLGRNATEDQP